MTAPSTEASASTAPVTQPTPASPGPSATAGPTPTSPTPATATAQEDNPWADPDKAKAEIERLRRENASARTKAKENAAEEARTELAQQIGKALGLVKDDEPVDPAKLTEQLTTATGTARQAQLELAVYRAAGDTADPSLLLDSRAFLDKVATLDPADTAGITQAITQAVTDNPRLARSQPVTPRVPAPNPAQGSSGTPVAASPAAAFEAILQGRLPGSR